jgi:phosphopantetheinyl transferase
VEGPVRAEWVARFWCAKEAVAKASGQGLNGGPRGLSVVAADAGSGELAVILGPALAEAWPELAQQPIRVRTALRGEYVWAWTIGEAWERRGGAL